MQRQQDTHNNNQKKAENEKMKRVGKLYGREKKKENKENKEKLFI